MVTKLISSQTIISKLISDLNISEEALRVSDIQEWIGEAALKIGGIDQMLTKVSGLNGDPILEINCHQAKLPCDLHRLHTVAYSFHECGPWVPMRTSTGTLHSWGCQCGGAGCEKCDSPRIIQDKYLAQTWMYMNRSNHMTPTQALEDLNRNEELRKGLTRLINTRDNRFPRWGDKLNFSRDPQYFVKPGYIVTNAPEGYLKISYSAVPRDEFGYVMIPEDESYIEAIYWYVVLKMKFPEWLRGEIDQTRYDTIQRKWNYYRKQAYGNLKMPNIDGLKSIQNAWNKLYPVMDEDSTFYSNVGQREELYNRNRNYYGRIF